MKILLIIIFNILIFCHSVFGQDPSFSQFYFNKVYFNPAFAGSTPGVELNLTHRNLWVGIPKGPLNFTTDKLSLGWDINKNLGISGILTNDMEGEKSKWEFPPLRTTVSGLQISGGISSKNFLIRGGVGGSMCWKKISWGNFIFSDQLDPVDGKIYNNSSFINPTAKYSRLYNINLTGGVIIKYSFNNRWTMLLGGARHRKFLQKNSFLTQSISMLDKWVLNLNLEIPTDQFKISPVFIYEIQKPMATIFMGTNFFNNHNPFFYGFAYRRLINSDALAFSGGFQGFLSTESHHKYSFYLSYDLPIGSVNSPGLGTLGAIEINLSLLFNNSRKPGDLVCSDWKMNLNESYGIHKTQKKIRGGSYEQKKNRKVINKRRKNHARITR